MDPLSVAASTIACQSAVSTFMRQWQPLFGSIWFLNIFNEIQDIGLLITEFSTKMTFYNQYLPKQQILTFNELLSSIMDILHDINKLLQEILGSNRGKRLLKVDFSQKNLEWKVQPFVEKLKHTRTSLTELLSALNRDAQRLAM